jgi:hypothetical protein
MTFYEGYSVEQLNRILNYSRWALGLFAVITALAGIFNQWIIVRIAERQQIDKSAAKKEADEKEASLQSELTILQAARTKVSRQLEHRHLTNEQRSQLIASLVSKPKGTVLLTCPINNPEAADFMNEIGSAVQAAGWQIARDIPRIFDHTPKGIELNIPTKDASNVAALSLDSALDAVGIVVSNRAVMPDLTVDIRMLVGEKPE